MKKIVAALVGVSLMLWGVMVLAGGAFLPALGIQVSWLQPWRLWPLIVIGVGDFLALLAMFFLRRRGMGAIFIPALPVMTTGAILFFASVFDQWHVWSSAWSLIVLALALGFVLAGITTRIVWFAIPAILIGMNALAFVFCSFTGLWSWWSVLWAIEPAAIGLVLLLVSYKSHSSVVGLIGILFLGFAAVAVPMMMGLVMVHGFFSALLGPAFLILLGGLVIAWGLGKGPFMRAERL